MVAGVSSHIEKRQSQVRSGQLSKVTDYLSEHPEQIDRVLIALQEGLFAKPAKIAADVLPIPESRTRIGLLSSKFLQECLQEVANQNIVDLASMRVKNGGDTIHKIWYFAMNEDSNTPVFTHDVQKFRLHYQRHYDLIGKRLQYLKKDDQNKLLWTQSGAYQIKREEEQVYVFHCSGQRATHLVTSHHCF